MKVFMSYCEIEIPILLTRLFVKYAIHYIYQLIYGKDVSAICGNVGYKKTIVDKGSIVIEQIWTVPNFSNFLSNDSGRLFSPKSRNEWQFQLALQMDKSNDNKLRVFYKSPTQILLALVRLKCFTFDKHMWAYDQTLSIISKQDCQIVKAETWYGLKSLSIMETHLQDFDKLIFLQNGSLYLKFEFVITIEKGYNDYHFKIPEPQLSNDMESVFLESKYTDAVMISADDKKFKVHKAVLASRSAVLNAHFEHEMTESITNIVKSHLDSAVLSEVLSFIYTDKTPKQDKIWDKLLAAADYYQLNRLKSLCEEALYKKLTVDNAIEILHLADLYSADTLKQLTLQFIKDGRRSLIAKTEGWAKLQSVDLMRRICE